MTVISDNWSKITERVAEACYRVQREPLEVRIVGVSKRKSASDILGALDAGCVIFGENYVQEAETKIPEVLAAAGSHSQNPTAARPEFHFIGHLQRNKIKRAISLFDMFQSVDSLKLGEALAAEYGKYIAEIASIDSQKPFLPILIQVNVSLEAQKGGISPDFVAELYASLLDYPVLDIQGLMTIGSLEADSATRAKEFSLLYKLRDSIEREFKKSLPCLSMGMSDDFEIAIAEGSSMIRIGSTLFGER